MSEQVQSGSAAAIVEVELSKPRRPALARLSVHPLLRNVGLTGLTSLVTSIAAMVVISLVGRILGPVLLGEYLLVRRMASWLQSVVVLPSGIALPRYVAASVDESPSVSRGYFVTAMAAGCGLALLLAAILLAWKAPASKLMFGTALLSPLILPLSLFLFALGAHGAVFGFYQGILSMGRACLLQLFNLAVFPILMVVWLARGRSIPLILDATGIAMILAALFFSMPVFRGVRLRAAVQHARARAAELLSFGLSRAWGDFGLQALLSLPAVIAAHFLSLRSVGFLLLGGTVLAVVAAATLPLGTILLAQVSRSLAQGRMLDLQIQVQHFIGALIESSLFVSLQMLVFVDWLLALWVGSSFSSAARIVQIMIVAVPFYFVYGGLRSVVDAAALKAHNTRNILFSLAFFGVAAAVAVLLVPRSYLLEGLSASVAISLAVLAYLTLRTVRLLFDASVDWVRLLPGVGLALLLGACSFGLHNVLHVQANLPIVILYEGAVCALFCVGLWRLRSPWLLFFVDLLLSRRCTEA